MDYKRGLCILRCGSWKCSPKSQVESTTPGVTDAGAARVSAALTDLAAGVQLFDRVGKRLVVNEHGRLLYPRALALLEQALEIEQLFRGR